MLENDPMLPTDMCFKSGKRGFRTVEVALRNPRNPFTWFGKQPIVAVTLGRKAFDDHRVAVTLTWAILAVGALMLAAGVVSQSLLTIGVGAVAMAVSGIFRAASPVTAKKGADESLTVRGACPTFLNRFEEG